MLIATVQIEAPHKSSGKYCLLVWAPSNFYEHGHIYSGQYLCPLQTQTHTILYIAITWVFWEGFMSVLLLVFL